MAILTQTKYKIGLAVVLIAVIALGAFALVARPFAGSQQQAPEVAAAAAAPTGAQGPLWTVRCTEAPKEGEAMRGKCEAFQRLIIQETGQRVAEFAIGYPEDKPAGRGVVVLPLGIDLVAGAQMKIDEGQAFKFSVRYCNEGGCVAFLDMNDDLIGMLRNGKGILISFKAASGQDMRVPMSMDGFAKALDLVSKS